MSPDDSQNVDELEVDRLLRERKQMSSSKKLNEYLKERLKQWLPNDKIEERYRNYKTKDRDGEKTLSPKSLKSEDECVVDTIDLSVVAQERKLDATELFIDGDYENTDISNDTQDQGDAEPLSEEVEIPFCCEDQSSANIDVDEQWQQNLWELSPDKRVDFLCALQNKIIGDLRKAVDDYQSAAKIHKDIQNINTVKILQEYDVIGMTVTGAATRLHLLNELKPSAVIVEEAAEIIEGQLISVLPPTIQHLVMLGDQEQLKPRVNCYELTKKNLDCSMFERLINNKMPYKQLGRQCRMRADIADLLTELNIYKDLRTNHEKTRNNVPPDCIKHSLYFVKHTVSEKQMKGSKSLWNEREILQILDVAVYLMKTGYPAADITVLCPYRGQAERMKLAFKEKWMGTSKQYFTKLKDIHITTVDSFQGEENKIILLSLVRSNEREKIGFFGLKNRICVAISRARCALYIFGNCSVYRTSRNWEKIINLLERRNLVGYRLPLQEESVEVDVIKDGEQFCETTRLSQPEINRLSAKILIERLQIARLANLEKGEIYNVIENVNYTQPKDKAAEILNLINSKSNFNRQELAEIMNEVGLDDVAEDILKGTLREPSSNDPESPVASPIEVHE